MQFRTLHFMMLGLAVTAGSITTPAVFAQAVGALQVHGICSRP